MSIFDGWVQRQEQQFADEVARGEHDDQCESKPRARICNCAMRRRIASGLTQPPMLHTQYPLCGHCYQEVEFDIDGFWCLKCHVSWNAPDTVGEFTDDNGPFTSHATEKESRP